MTADNIMEVLPTMPISEIADKHPETYRFLRHIVGDWLTRHVPHAVAARGTDKCCDAVLALVDLKEARIEQRGVPGGSQFRVVFRDVDDAIALIGRDVQ